MVVGVIYKKLEWVGEEGYYGSTRCNIHGNTR